MQSRTSRGSQRDFNEKEMFSKVQQLEFQNELIRLQLKHIEQRKKNQEQENKRKIETLQNELNIMRKQQSQKSLKIKKSYELSNSSSSSSDESRYDRNDLEIQLKNIYKIINNNFHSCFEKNLGSIQETLILIQMKRFQQLTKKLFNLLEDLMLKINAFSLQKTYKFEQNDIQQNQQPENKSYFGFETFNKEKISKQVNQGSIEKTKIQLSDIFDKIRLNEQGSQRKFEQTKQIEPKFLRKNKSQLMPHLQRKKSDDK